MKYTPAGGTMPSISRATHAERRLLATKVTARLWPREKKMQASAI